MGSLFFRIKNSIEADLHDLLDQKEQKNPIAVLNQYLRQCEAEVEKTRKLVERQYLLKEEFVKEHHIAVEMAEKRKYQAEVAEKAGEQELHDFAQKEQLQYEERANALSASLQKASAQLNELERKYESMKHKLKDMNLKRLELMGRENIVRAHHQMNKVLDQSAASAGSNAHFNEMENYLDSLEQKVNSAYYRETIEAKIALLEKEAKNKETHTIS
ncbi:PspA/IM30 family protein [Falsibacillus pallidus]|uniref:Phage shock protein A (PspA) family protein n=1 Tax=Falsibacillus pallidus TaxID=493781 RepID=A0A370GK20_9BACI|nr:PspA/IM30 family protein [Falsibacillus pallidus]RDI42293.1 phage shock protein A (PspA) family protein [Falsibacillus pallidus]